MSLLGSNSLMDSPCQHHLSTVQARLTRFRLKITSFGRIQLDVGNLNKWKFQPVGGPRWKDKSPISSAVILWGQRTSRSFQHLSRYFSMDRSVGPRRLCPSKSNNGKCPKTTCIFTFKPLRIVPYVYYGQHDNKAPLALIKQLFENASLCHCISIILI